jgi:hypothetical protein
MSKKDDLLDKMIAHLEKKRVDIIPHEKQDIDAADSKALHDAQAKLHKRGGFPVEGTQTTENQEQARERERMRRAQLRKQRAEAEKSADDHNSLKASRVEEYASETEEDQYEQHDDDED